MKHQYAIFGAYQYFNNAQLAFHKLLNAGFRRNDIKIRRPILPGPRDFSYVLRTNIGFGAQVGAVVGAILGLLMVMVIFRSDMTWINTTLGLVLGFFLGLASGALVGIGTPERAPHRYAEYLETGATLLSVRVKSSDRAKLASQILEVTGAADISEHEERGTWAEANLKQMTSEPPRPAPMIDRDKTHSL